MPVLVWHMYRVKMPCDSSFAKWAFVFAPFYGLNVKYYTKVYLFCLIICL